MGMRMGMRKRVDQRLWRQWESRRWAVRVRDAGCSKEGKRCPGEWGWGTRRQKRSLSRRRRQWGKRVLNNNLSEILVNSLRGKIMFFYHDDIKVKVKVKVPSGLMDTPEDQ
ncbi:hypothetical protein OsI_15223 [Oryza sativa Indica Group]|uniref:Uncharacterized protein n=2 Tax=Oryza sativa TaxID=4530 RepID=A3ARY9_ORYSJ|nr:hypothetical protein OsI_15223 [Oryza sativa Indica Group]EAZ30078.1 hypothetical protein OsJ_14139 [Oryza sativa Japonica Group]